LSGLRRVHARDAVAQLPAPALSWPEDISNSTKTVAVAEGTTSIRTSTAVSWAQTGQRTLDGCRVIHCEACRKVVCIDSQQRYHNISGRRVASGLHTCRRQKGNRDAIFHAVSGGAWGMGKRR
jgi:hypothetical protein